MSKTIFLHLTDLHITAPTLEEPGVLSDTRGTLEQVKTLISSLPEEPAFILVSGDLTNKGDTVSFVTLKKMMADIETPIFYALGNHDTRKGYYEGFLDAEASDAYVDYEATIAGLHLIVLDTSRTSAIGGFLDDSQFDFLTRCLGNHQELTKIIMFHHPPLLDEDPDWAFEGLRWTDSVRLADVLLGHDIAGIFCGHIHQDRVSHWHGIPLIVGNGTHWMGDIFYSGAGIRHMSGASIGLCTLRDSGLTVNFFPLPSDRSELAVVSLEDIKKYEAARAE